MLKSIFLPLSALCPLLVSLPNTTQACLKRNRVVFRSKRYDPFYNYTSNYDLDEKALLNQPATTQITNTSYALPVAGFVLPLSGKRMPFHIIWDFHSRLIMD